MTWTGLLIFLIQAVNDVNGALCLLIFVVLTVNNEIKWHSLCIHVVIDSIKVK